MPWFAWAACLALLGLIVVALLNRPPPKNDEDMGRNWPDRPDGWRK